MDRTFTYTWPDAKRLTVLHALGFMYAKLATTPKAVTETVEALIGELSTTPGQDCPAPCALHNPANPASGTDAARAVLAPPAPSDYFARDRKGNVLMTAPNGAEFQVLKIVGTAKTTKFLKVVLANRGSANCFDTQLWPLIEKQDGKEAGLWIQKSADGKYLNIVGVRQ